MTPALGFWRMILAGVLAGVGMAAIAQSGEPAAELRVQVSMSKPGDLTVGATNTLYLDVLTSTWFTDAPTLPVLSLPNALVTQPTGQATHIRSAIQGETFTGLRFGYLISPTAVGTLQIPALTVSARVGQSTSPVQAQSTPLRVKAVSAPGLASGADRAGQTLVADSVDATQQFRESAQPLSVGDRISREITIKAIGTQAMLIPPVEFADIAGLKRYVTQPTLSTITDGRGGFEGGQRIERADYVVERAGTYALPAIDLPWWNLGTKTQEHVLLPAHPVQALAGARSQGPFSVTEDLRELGHGARFYVHGGWFALFAIAAGAALVLWFAWPWCRRGTHWLGRKRAAVRTRWQGSEPHAWLALRRELSHPNHRLDALYQWLRRSRDVSTLGQALRPLPVALRTPGDAVLRDCYGPDATPTKGFHTLRAMVPRWRRAFRVQAHPVSHYGLRPLNPHSASCVGVHRSHDGEAL